MGSAAEATGLGLVCFVVINPRVSINFPFLHPPPLPSWSVYFTDTYTKPLSYLVFGLDLIVLIASAHAVFYWFKNVRWNCACCGSKMQNRFAISSLFLKYLAK